jgi:ketopantoate reductase
MEIAVSIIGAGSWGTTVAALASRNTPTLLWSRRSALAEQIDRDHENGDYLPGFRLPDQLRATDDLERAVRCADLLVMGVPSHGFRSSLEAVKPFLRPWVPVISLSKGLELGTRLRMSQLVEEVLPGHPGGRAHRAQPGQGDPGWPRGGQRDRHAGRQHRRVRSRRSSRPTCSGCTPTRTWSAANWVACSRT